MSTLIKSLIKYTFGKKLFTAMMFVIVVFSAIFTAFTFRLGTAFAYDSVSVGEYFRYRFEGQNTNRLSDENFRVALEKYGFDRLETYYAYNYHTLTAGDYKDSEYSVHILFDVEEYGTLDGISDLITSEDVAEGKKLLIVDRFTVSKSGGQVDVGKTVYLNGVEYLVVSTDGVDCADGRYYSSVAVGCAELEATYDALNYFVYTQNEVPNRILKNFAKDNGITAVLPEKSKYIVAFFILSAVICALFVANLAVLFNAFVKANAKFYTVFKILGITTAKFVAASCLPCVMVAFCGALVGVGVDYAIASFTTVLEKPVYLTAGGAAAIVLLNVIGAFVGSAIACALQANKMPAESLRRAE